MKIFFIFIKPQLDSVGQSIQKTAHFPQSMPQLVNLRLFRLQLLRQRLFHRLPSFPFHVQFLLQ